MEWTLYCRQPCSGHYTVDSHAVDTTVDSCGVDTTVDSCGVDTTVDSCGVDTTVDSCGVDATVDSCGVDAIILLYMLVQLHYVPLEVSKRAWALHPENISYVCKLYHGL